MTLKSEQKVALQLAAKGFQPDIIAEILKVNVRSVQRWLSKHKKLTADSDDSEPTITVDDPVTSTVVSLPEQFVENENLQQKAMQMLESGLQPGVIAEQLGTSVRSVQRWLSSNNSPEETQNLISTYPTELQSAFLSKAPNTPSWVDDTEQALSEHQECHREIRRKLVTILHNQLDAVEPNFRSVHIVSQALIRHTIAEREALNVEWLDINRAMMLIRSYGLGVVDFGQLEALKRERAENLSQPQ